ADAAAKLVELGEAETLGVLDDHYGGVGNVYADFDHGGGHQDLDFVFAKALHHVIFFYAGQAAVQQAQFQLGKNFFRQSLILLHRSFQLDFRFFNYRINDVGLMAGLDFAADAAPNAGKML